MLSFPNPLSIFLLLTTLTTTLLAACSSPLPSYPPSPPTNNPPAPTSFCKCTCFTNSTIIPLDAPVTTTPSLSHTFLAPRIPEEQAEEPLPDANPPGDGDGDEKGQDGKGGDGKEGENRDGDGDGDRREYRAGNCNDCNRQFCLDYNLPICKGAKVEDVFTTCFRMSPSLVSPIPSHMDYSSSKDYATCGG